MACGSGSFLLGAYQCLLDHCQKWYLENRPEKHKEAVYLDRRGKYWRLAIAEKKRILITHIFGVDIDLQAVEVSKLSLLLKVLEGETDETVGQSRQLFHERALPNLSNNIKCGNSLIGPDYFSGRLIPDPDEMKRVNPFDWQREFPDAMGSGGFDCVIGNPPYVRIQTLQEWMPETAEYLKQAYNATKAGNYDIYIVFIEHGLSLLNSRGRLGFIMPQKFWQVQYGEPLRELLSAKKHVALITSFTHNQVFDNAFVNASILVLTKLPSESFEYVEVKKINKEILLSQALENAKISKIKSRILGKAPWILKTGYITDLIGKISKCGIALENCTLRIFQGLKTSADKIFVLDLIKENNSTYIAYSPHLGIEVEIERDIFHTLIKGTEMRRFVPLQANRILLFPYVSNDGITKLISEDCLKKKYPKTYSYLKTNEKYLRDRESGKMNHEGWYGFGRNQALDVISQPKIITPDLAPQSAFLEDAIGDFYFLGGAAGGYGIIPKPDFDSRFLLGLLNSKLLSFFITSSGQQLESGYYSFEARFIRSAPIKAINYSNSADSSFHEDLVKLVVRMLSFHKQIAAVNSETHRGVIQRQIKATDCEIDRLVYELYGLTKEEIKIVEEI
ncbi:MAG TPA: Eco57I restriction-modification methylase domain-containing protein, partial [Candidatus Glassbacteria bacterium]|nr:Eco57I restriction-modification methylase domain-containing protein [Candidatus Glassbacteria bacterium]